MCPPSSSPEPAPSTGTGRTDRTPLDRRGILLIATVLSLGFLVAVQTWPADLLSIPESEWKAWAALTVFTLMAQWVEVRFHRQSFSPNLVFLFAGTLLLSPFLFVLQTVLVHLIEWAWKRWQRSDALRDWYIQPFNISTHILAGLFAARTHHLLSDYLPGPALQIELVAATLAAMVYVLLNHLIIGEALLVLRGIHWQDSQLLELDTLMPDFALAMIGYTVALLWTIDPWLTLPALVPLVLVYQALQVPGLKQAAATDEKTGLLNARRFRKRLEEELAQAAQLGRPISLIMADLDLLRTINNTYGHLAGDVVLEQVARIIRDSIREQDLACRFGGEEFAIALPETSLDGAYQVAEQIRRTIENAAIALPEFHTTVQVTLSLGVATFPQDGQDATALLHEADIALYHAKRLGRNRVVPVAGVPPWVRLDHRNHVHHTRALEPAETARGSRSPESNARPLQGAVQEAPSQERRTSRTFPGNGLVMWAVLGLLLAGLAWSMSRLSSNAQVLGLLLGMAAATQLFRVPALRDEPYERVSLSPGVVPLAALLSHVTGLALVSLALGLVHHLRWRAPVHRTLLRTAIYFVAGLLLWKLYSLVPVTLTVENLQFWVPFVLIGGLLYFLVETTLLTLVLGMGSRRSLYSTWRQTYHDLFSYYLAMAVIGLGLALFYRLAGIWGPLLLAVPGYMLYRFELTKLHHALRTIDRSALSASAEGWTGGPSSLHGPAASPEELRSHSIASSPRDRRDVASAQRTI